MRPSYRTTLSVHPCVPTFDTSISHIHPSTHHLSLFLPPSHLFICICHLSVYPPTHPPITFHPSTHPSSLSFIHHLLYHLSTYHLSTSLPTCPLSVPTYLSHIYLSSIGMYLSSVYLSSLSLHLSVPTSLCLIYLRMYICGSSRHLSIYQEREIIFKELAHAAVRAGRSKSSG